MLELDARAAVRKARQEGWDAALDRAAAVVLEATGIPRDARNPTRDRLVIEGEHIAKRLLALKQGTGGFSDSNPKE